ncbi:hypothetical protein ACIPVB_06170 [Microbacterium sp. NPDC090007]|uniref:hypothetical protein n=1 Tax=Microbacterium sp. NPDC090007 TaxID=3364204 RepID=UPI003814ED5C
MHAHIRPSGPSKTALIKRILGFSALPILGGILPLVALSLIGLNVASDVEWVGMNVGLSVGGIAGAVALVGWNVLGTPLIALAKRDEDRRNLYARSFYIRAAASITLAVVASLVSALVAPEAALASAAFATAAALGGLTMSWYAVGVARPSLILWFDIVPRAMMTITGVGLTLLTGSIVWYAVGLGTSVVLGAVAFHAHLLRKALPPWPGWGQMRRDVREMRAAWGVESVGNSFANAPLPLAGIFGSIASAAGFASADKIYRYGIMGVAAVANALQGWALEVTGASRARRNIISVLLMCVVALIGLLVLAVGGTWLSASLFGADKAGDAGTLLFYGIAFFCVTMSTPLIRNVLIPARRDRAVFRATVGAATVGLAAMTLLGSILGPLGVAIGFAASEALMLVACAALSARAGLRGLPSAGPPVIETPRTTT